MRGRRLDVTESSLLAWAGWRLSVPYEWRPLKLSGTQEKGKVIVGNSECAVFMLKWERVRNKPSRDGREWVAQRLKKMGTIPSADPPAAAAFTACGWAHGVHVEEGEEATYWFGYSAPAGLLVGVIVNGGAPEPARRDAVRAVLPTLQTTPVDAFHTWAMHDIGFSVPPGFELARRHLYSGDVALEFVRGKRERLLLRQVYPGELALQRRGMEKWLERYPFKEHRRIRARTVRIQEWRCGAGGERAGVERRAWKRLPSPLGWCAPRRVHGVAVLDEQWNRLLIAEHMAADEPAKAVCEQAIVGMNARPDEV